MQRNGAEEPEAAYALPLRPGTPGPRALPVLVECSAGVERRAKYALESLLMAAGILVEYVAEPPGSGPWLLYSSANTLPHAQGGGLHVSHQPEAWARIAAGGPLERPVPVDGVQVVLGKVGSPASQSGAGDSIDFDLLANTFFFLSSAFERGGASSRKLYGDSPFARLGVAQDIVDRYLALMRRHLDALADQVGTARFGAHGGAPGARFAVVLSHDVDFLPSGSTDVLVQGAKTLARHLVRQRNPVLAARAGVGLLRALLSRRDPYGCIPEIIAEEQRRGVRSSFQVAVARRHPSDVNYSILDDRTRDYLRVIPDAGFDLCLHGSYRSTEQPDWYPDEARVLGERLATPSGSRQHFLSFDYDALFAAQERAGIRYDMSMGYPDHPGPRAGFSHPYFPYCLAENRPYNVVEISLFLMDVTLQSYLGLGARDAWSRIERTIGDLRDKGGIASVVWHPIVFGGARDPGYDELYWRLVEYVKAEGGLATDGRTVDHEWRRRASLYPSFNPDSKA